jgi:hypothetical protein
MAMGYWVIGVNSGGGKRHIETKCALLESEPEITVDVLFFG